MQPSAVSDSGVGSRRETVLPNGLPARTACHQNLLSTASSCMVDFVSQLKVAIDGIFPVSLEECKQLARTAQGKAKATEQQHSTQIIAATCCSVCNNLLVATRWGNIGVTGKWKRKWKLL